MNLAKVRSVVEHDSHFVVDDGVGKPFKVAKQGLSAATREKIAAVASGKLARYNEGGLAESLPPEPAPMESSPIGVDAAAKAGISPEAYNAAVEAAQPQLLAMAPKREDFTPSFADAGLFSPVGSVGHALGESLGRAIYGASADDKRYEAAQADYQRSLPTLTHELAMQKASIVAPPAAAPTPAPSPVQLPPENAFLPAGPTSSPAPLARPGGSSTTALPVVPAMPAAPVIPAGEASPEFKAALDEQKKAADSLGAVRVKEADAAAAAAAERQAKLEEIAKQSELEKKAKSDEYAAREKAYRENEIDPNRMFGSLGTGRKVAAALSLFAGGFASAYTGKNYALDIFNKAIDDDIAAQKDKKNSQYNLYLRAGDDAKTAEARARADVATAISAKLEAGAAKLLPEKAQAEVAKAAADLRLRRNTEIEAAVDRDTARKTEAVLNPLRVQNEQGKIVATQFGMEADRARLGMQGEQLGLQKRQANLAEREFNERKLATQEARNRDAAIRAMTGMMASGAVDVAPGTIENLPKEVRERAVQVEPGKWTLAKSEKDREKADLAIAASDQIKSSLDKLIALADPKGQGRELLPTEAAAKADVISKIVQMALKQGMEMGAFDKGSATFLEGLVANPTAVLQTNALTRLQTLRTSEESRLRASLNSHLLRPMRAETQWETAAEEASAKSLESGGTPVAVRYSSVRK